MKRAVFAALLTVSSFGMLGVIWNHAMVSVDAGLAVASGYGTGFLDRGATVNKFGHNQDSDQTEDAISDVSDFGGPIRCFTITIGATMNISSDNAGDTGQVTVSGLDSDYVEQSATTTLAGLTYTEVISPSGKDWLYINRAFAVDEDLIGNVYIHNDAVDEAVADGIPDLPLTQLISVIDANENQTMQACYAVPAGVSAMLLGFHVDNVNVGGSADGSFRLRKMEPGGANRTQYIAHVAEGDHEDRPFNPPLNLPEKTLIELTNISSANGGTVAGSFDLLLLPVVP